MKILTAIVLILSALMSSEVVYVGAQTYENVNIEMPAPEIPAQEVSLSQVTVISREDEVIQTPTAVETPYPEPSYTPALTTYLIDKNHDIWRARYPTSYITPDNEWVKYYASLLYIDYDGRIRYKNRPVPLEVDTKGNVLYWMDEPFINNYVPDNEQFRSSPDGDMWVMPEYYLTHGMRDDCDGWMAAVTSMMLSGEMSVRENGDFVKKVIPAKAVLGYMSSYRDGWTEYQVYGKTFLTTTALISVGIEGNEKMSSTEFTEKKNKRTARYVFEFTDKYFGKYSE